MNARIKTDTKIYKTELEADKSQGILQRSEYDDWTYTVQPLGDGDDGWVINVRDEHGQHVTYWTTKS